MDRKRTLGIAAGSLAAAASLMAVPVSAEITIAPGNPGSWTPKVVAVQKIESVLNKLTSKLSEPGTVLVKLTDVYNKLGGTFNEFD